MSDGGDALSAEEVRQLAPDVLKIAQHARGRLLVQDTGKDTTHAIHVLAQLATFSDTVQAVAKCASHQLFLSLLKYPHAVREKLTARSSQPFVDALSGLVALCGHDGDVAREVVEKGGLDLARAFASDGSMSSQRVKNWAKKLERVLVAVPSAEEGKDSGLKEPQDKPLGFGARTPR